ncbi:MAG: IS1595 family transposase [Bryobacteraceae bacterium]|jgi:transposase-like protein
MDNEINTLQAAILHFADLDNCLDYLVARRWPRGVICPTCGSKDVSFVPSRRVWQCKTRHPKCQFSIKVGTIFEDSPIGLDKWLCAMWMVANCKNGVSSHEIARSLSVTQKTAWFMLHRIRLALQGWSQEKLGGPGREVEVDETFVGGKARNMHKARRLRMLQGKGGGAVGKAAVQGMLERGGRVRVSAVPDTTYVTLVPNVRKHVELGSKLYSDDASAYFRLRADYMHATVDHTERYVDGAIHTNGLENFWSLLKRTLSGTYISVEPFHLFRYLDEQAFRYNFRKDMNDGDRFKLAASQIVGKRLTYAELTGKVGQTWN